MYTYTVYLWLLIESGGYKKAQNIRSIVDQHRLPVKVLFDNPSFTMTLHMATARTLGTSLSLDNDSPLNVQGSLKIVRQYTETFYVINYIVNGRFFVLRSGWRRSVVVSALSSINAVNQHSAWLVLGWVTVYRRVNHFGM